MRELSLDQYRYFLKEAIRQEIDFTATDENHKVPPPPWRNLSRPMPRGTICRRRGLGGRFRRA